MRTAHAIATDMAHAQSVLRSLYADQRRRAGRDFAALTFSRAIAISVHRQIERQCGVLLALVPAANDCGGMVA